MCTIWSTFQVEGSNSEINVDSSSPETERPGRSIHENPKWWHGDSRRLHVCYSSTLFWDEQHSQKQYLTM